MKRFETISCKRDALYEQVWSEPVTKLAKRYGLSDVGFAKVCKRYGIPLPGRGYWQKLGNGAPTTRPSLPVLMEDLGDVVFRVPKDTAPGSELPETAQIVPQTQAELDSANRIVVAAELESPHPYIKSTRVALRDAKLDDRAILRPNPPCVDIRVSKSAVDRALRIMDAILKGLDARGYSVSLEKIYGGGEKAKEVSTSVLILDKTIEIELDEVVERFDHRPTDTEKKKQKEFKYPWHTWPKYDFRPTGRLTLKIINAWHTGIRKSWSDGKQQRLEDCLNDFFVSLYKVALEKRAEQLERERKESERKVWEAQQAELERQRREEEGRFQQLVKDSKAWRQSDEIRSYIDAVRKAAIEKHGDIALDSELGKWIHWATARADEIDPSMK